jgi:hypothetical protein
MDHIVLCTFKKNVNATTVKNVFDQVRQSLLNIPNVISVEAGTSFTENRARGFHHGICVHMSSSDALDEYNKHPNQKTVAKMLLPLLSGETKKEKMASMMVVDLVSPRLEKKETNFTTAVLSLTTVGLACTLGAILYRKK